MGELLYVQKLVAKQFQDAEKANEPTKLAFEIELDLSLLENASAPNMGKLQPRLASLRLKDSSRSTSK